MTAGSLIEFRFNGTVYRPLFPDILRPLSFEERQDLEASVKAHGVQVPVLVDEHDNLIDGMHRCLVAESCGLTEIPVRKVGRLSGEDKRALAFELNDCRRQQSLHELGSRRKTRAEKRAAIAAVVIEAPELSDRAIAEKVKEKTGEKPHNETVGEVRKQLTESEEIRQLPRTTGKDGKSRPARRPVEPTPTPPPAEKPPVEQPDPGPRAEAPKPPPKPRAKPYDWSELAKRLDGPRAKLDGAASAVRVLVSGGGDPSFVPGRLEGVNEVLASTIALIQEVIKWQRQAFQS